MHFLPFGKISLKTAKPKPYPASPKTLGDHLKKRRHELELFQKDVAALLKVNAWTITNWERGRTYPSVRYLPRIIDFLDYDPYPASRSLSERIASGRRRLGLPQKELARRLGVDEGTLAKWENGVRQPTGWRVQVVEDFLASET